MAGQEIRLELPVRLCEVKVMRSTADAVVVGRYKGLVHIYDRSGAVLRTFQVGPSPVSEVLADGDGVKAAYCPGRLTLFQGGQIVGATALPEQPTLLASCGAWVLAWSWKSAWVVSPDGGVMWAAEMERPIVSAWGDAGGFYLLAGQLLALRPVVLSPEPRSPVGGR